MLLRGETEEVVMAYLERERLEIIPIHLIKSKAELQQFLYDCYCNGDNFSDVSRLWYGDEVVVAELSVGENSIEPDFKAE